MAFETLEGFYVFSCKLGLGAKLVSGSDRFERSGLVRDLEIVQELIFWRDAGFIIGALGFAVLVFFEVFSRKLMS